MGAVAACRRQSAVTFVVAAVSVGVVLSGCSGFGRKVPTRDDSGAIVQEAETNPFALVVGDCIEEPEIDASGELSSLTVIPCSDPHSSEAYAVKSLPDGEYPGDAAVTAAADDFCLGEFESFVGLPYEQSELAVHYQFPSGSSWMWKEDRQILCLVGLADAVPTVGSLKDAAR